MQELLAIFADLPSYLKLVVAMGFLVPLLAIYNYINPAPPPPPPPADGRIVMPDGKIGRVYMDGDVYVKKGKR